jgi:hypothetical protein
MAQHSNYWSCSKFADWLRGTPKLHAGTSKEWRLWKQQAEAAHKIRFWLAEEGLDYIQDFVTYPIRKIYDLKYYINNRWVTRTHALTAHPRDIKRGQWCDVGNRFLPCLFNELVDYVEVELAWWHIAWGGKAEKQKYNAPFWATGWFRWRTWRCKQAGLDNLEWQRNLVWNQDEMLDKDDPRWGKPTSQAINAKEILDLYKWWTEVYPNRPDPHDAGGWSAYCELKRLRGDDFFDVENRTEEEKKMASDALDKTQAIEEAYRKEDEEMMIRLIKIRDSLWT